MSQFGGQQAEDIVIELEELAWKIKGKVWRVIKEVRWVKADYSW